MVRRIVIVLALTLVVATPAGAVTIVEWDLASATGQSADPLATAGNVTATAITASAGVTAWASTTQDGFVAASGWAPGSSPDPTKYYEWTVTADPGFGIAYGSISLALFRGIQTGNHGAQLWDLRASTDGFASSDLFLQTFDITAAPADTQTPFLAADVSALGTQVATVTFRLFGYDYTSAADFSGLGNDSGWLIYGSGTNPRIDGTVVVPEPGTGMLLVLGLALGLHRRIGREPAPRLLAGPFGTLPARGPCGAREAR